MDKIAILKKAGITKDFQFYEIEETETEYKVFDMRGDILGCILPGLALADINKDGIIDVASSKDAMKKLLALLPDKFKLEIS